MGGLFRGHSKVFIWPPHAAAEHVRAFHPEDARRAHFCVFIWLPRAVLLLAFLVAPEHCRCAGDEEDGVLFCFLPSVYKIISNGLLFQY